MEIDNIQRWHFVLEPSLESTLPMEQLEGDLLDRAGAMRDELEATSPVDDQEAPAHDNAESDGG